MKKYIVLPIILLLTLLCNSCVDEPIVKNEEVQDKLHIRITTTDPEIIETRTSTDNAIQNVYILIFDKNEDSGVLKGIVQATSSDSKNFYASLTDEGDNGQMYVIANAADKIASLKGSWTETTTLEYIKENLFLTFPQSADKKYITSDEIAEASPMIGGVQYKGQAESYSVTLTRATAKVSVVNSSGNARYKLLGANAGNAPVSGYVFSGMSFKIEKANYAGKGNDGKYSPENMMKGMEEADPVTPSVNPTTTKPLYLFESVADNETFVIIKGEYNGIAGYHKLNIWKHDTKVFLDIQRNFHYKVLINKIYTTGYKTAQEAIENEAAANSDVDYGIDITDGVSLDIVTNGRYYLGLTNTEYLLYSPDELSGVTIATVATNATGDASPGTLEVKVTEGTGEIKCEDSFTKTNDGKFQSKAITPTIPATVLKAEFILRVGDLAQTIRFERVSNNLAFGGCMELPHEYAYAKIVDKETKWASFAETKVNNASEGKSEYFNSSGKNATLYLAYDHNMVLEASGEKPPRAAEVLLFKANDEGHTRIRLTQPSFKIFDKPDKEKDGYIANPYVGAFWRHNQTGERVIKMTATGGDLSGLSWSATVVVGYEWIRLQNGGSVDGNIYTNGAILGNDPNFESTCQLTDRTKTVISQPRVENGKGDVTFRIGLSGTIEESEHRYGLIIVSTYSNDVLQNSYRIFVRQGEAPDYLFRKEDPTATPEKWPIKDGKIRPKTVKLSPFNLTDPNAGIGGTGNYSTFNAMPMDYNKTSDSFMTFNKNKFTEYPSLAGYFFIWNAQYQNLTDAKIKGPNQWIRAIHPLFFSGVRPGVAYVLTIPDPLPINTYAGNYSGDGDGNLPMYGFGTEDGHEGRNPVNWTQIELEFDQRSDPCPYGYRTPHLSDGWKDDGDVLYIGENAKYSELLQSLFYEPYITEGTNNMGKYTLWGYYADGFYDRLSINPDYKHSFSISYKSGNTNKTKNLSFRAYNCVFRKNTKECTGNDIGYIGGITFNPFNFASIFSPAAGTYTQSTFLDTSTWDSLPYGEPLEAGQSYLYWTANRYNNKKNSTDIPLFLFASGKDFYFENAQGTDYFGKSIRCVRDETYTPKNVIPAEYN